MLPLIPILAILAIAGGTATLIWYSDLSKAEKEAADRRMNELAISWFRKKFIELANSQQKQIIQQVKKEMKKR